MKTRWGTLLFRLDVSVAGSWVPSPSGLELKLEIPELNLKKQSSSIGGFTHPDLRPNLGLNSTPNFHEVEAQVGARNRSWMSNRA